MALQWFDYDYRSPDHQCRFRWKDPTPKILDDLSKIPFAASMDAAQGSYEIFNATQTIDTLVYISAYQYLAAGSIILFIAIVAVWSTLWGWWEIGRDVTLSPLETARALGVHLFQHGAEMDAEGLVSRTVGRRFRYGQRIELQSDGIEREVLQLTEIGIGSDPIIPGHRRSTYPGT